MLMEGCKALMAQVSTYSSSTKGNADERAAKKVIGFVAAAGRAAMKGKSRKGESLQVHLHLS